jgi:serine/threonine protein kinase
MAPQSFEEMLRLTENLSEKYVVGRGGSSTVYKCTLKNGHSIAIKKLLSCPQNIHEFENELNTLGNIKHRNIVCLRGYSMSAAGNFLFYDFMENGSLYDLLHGTYSFTNLLRRMRFTKLLNAYKKTGHSKPVTSSLFQRFLELGNGYKQMKLPLMMAGQVKKTGICG